MICKLFFVGLGMGIVSVKGKELMMFSPRFILRFICAILFVPCLLLAQPGGWSPRPSSTLHNLYGVVYRDSSTWIAVGDSGTILRSTNAGFDWSSIASPVIDALRAVSFHGPTGIAVGIGGRILRTTDSGANWINEPRPTTKGLYAVSCGDSMAVITGEEGSIFVSIDDGVSWSQRTAGTASVLFGVSVNGNVGVGVGGAAAVVMSDNRGAGWGLTILGTQLTFLYGVSFATPLTGWAVGTYPSGSSLVIRSDISGFTWSAQSAPSTDILFGVSFVDTSTGMSVGGNGTIIRTTDGGRNWSAQSSGVTQSLNAVSMFTSQFGIVVGNGGTILRTTSGGIMSVSTGENQIPTHAVLEQNYPNPFNPATHIRFSLSRSSYVTLRIYDLLGREVASLISGEEEAGIHELSWNPAGVRGGIYLCRLQAGTFSVTRKLLLVQ